MKIKITDTIEVTVRCSERESVMIAAAVAQALNTQQTLVGVEHQLIQLGTVQTVHTNNRLLTHERVRNG